VPVSCQRPGWPGYFSLPHSVRFARSAWLVTYAVTRRQLSRFRRQNSVPMDGRGPETVNDVKRNAAVAGAAAASTPHIQPVGADLRPSDHDITLPADIDRQPVYAASAAIGRYLPPAPELRQTIRIPHVAAAVDRRGRQTDGRTDTRSLQRRSPLEAGSVSNTSNRRCVHVCTGVYAGHRIQIWFAENVETAVTIGLCSRAIVYQPARVVLIGCLCADASPADVDSTG